MSEAARLRESRRLRAQGRRLTQRRRWSAAERTFEEALMFTPDDPWVYRDLAVFEFRQGELDRAEAWARAAIEKDPDEEQFYITLGDTLGAKRDLAGARAAWEQALGLNRRSRAAQRRLDRLGRP
jgi:tetratricopeptide (TPR) repeat protein